MRFVDFCGVEVNPVVFLIFENVLKVIQFFKILESDLLLKGSLRGTTADNDKVLLTLLCLAIEHHLEKERLDI